MALLLDTGILYALADEDDHWHERARELLHERPDILLVPLTVLPEAAYLLRHKGECVETKNDIEAAGVKRERGIIRLGQENAAKLTTLRGTQVPCHLQRRPLLWHLRDQ